MPGSLGLPTFKDTYLVIYNKKLEWIYVLFSLINPCPAEPGYILPLQTV